MDKLQASSVSVLVFGPCSAVVLWPVRSAWQAEGIREVGLEIVFYSVIDSGELERHRVL